VTAERGSLPPDVAAALSELDELIQMFTKHPDDGVQEAVIGVLRAVDALHRGGLLRLAALLEARSLLDVALADPSVALLFDLYGAQDVESDDERSRAEAAVAKIRPEVEAHGGRLEVITAEGGVVNVRLSGAADSFSESRAKLLGLVEEALRAALPEFVRMNLSPIAEGRERPPEPTPVVIPLSRLTRRSPSPARSGTAGPGGCSCG
jgi:Fe-S cluster biogenesis protein NfuA